MANILLIQQTITAYHIIESALSYDAHTLQVAHGFNVDGWRGTPDLIIVQMSESVQNDVCFCEQIRTNPRFAKTPILALTEIKSTNCGPEMLDGGCDDIMCAPIVGRLLAARVRALLRRKPSPQKQDVLILNSRTRTARLGERSLGLTNIEYDLLETLCNYVGQQVSTSALLQEVWRYAPGQGDKALVRNHVRNLRRKLESAPDHPRILLCFQGRGYTIAAEILQD